MRLAIVTPWFGRELKGGAEQHAWQVASRLAKRGHGVEVLTTCCRSHQDDWATNHLPAGVNEEPEGFIVRRFSVDPRNKTSFDRVCAKLLSIPGEALKPGASPVDASEAEVFVNHLIRSQALLDYVTREGRNYENVILLPYLYGPVIQATMALQERAVLQPCLHNEAYAYLPQIRQAFHAAGKLLFISEGERELALRLFGPGIWRKAIVGGAGVELTGHLQSGSNGSTALGPSGDYLLYLGRKHAGKNVPLLLRAFRKFKSVRPNSTLKLVLAGHGAVENNGCDSIIDAGVISETDKVALLKECRALVQPSTNESFSRVMMEAWQLGRPVAVHASCLATAAAVRKSGGGWLAEAENDWAELFTIINRQSATDLAEVGHRGFEYAKLIGDWENVLRRYEEALESDTVKADTTAATTPGRQEIHQVLPNMANGDAISNQALFIRAVLRAAGYVSNIYVRHADPDISHECSALAGVTIAPSAGIIYHHSIGSEVTPRVVAHPGPKFLVYHNITPDVFYEPYRPEFAEILRAGREELSELARQFPNSAGDSGFNSEELKAHGFNGPAILPIAVDPLKWEVPADSQIMSEMQDGRTNILFVGRVAPNKKQDDLIDAFETYLTLDPGARLVLAGLLNEEDPYASYIRDLIESRGLADSVRLTDCVNDGELAAYYRSAHLFWSMSEHEGFGVPLVEAMWFDIPVLAFKSSAVPETLGDAAFMFTSKSDIERVAALAHLVVTDRKLREAIINAQRQRRLAFLPEEVSPLVLKIAQELTATVGS